MTGPSKNPIHIWDNVLDSFGTLSQRQRKPTVKRGSSVRDSTGTTMDYVAFERKLTTEVTKTTTHYDNESDYYGGRKKVNDSGSAAVRRQSRQSNKALYVTDAQRAQAQPPVSLRNWEYISDRSQTRFDKEAALSAFAEYGRRVKERKREREQAADDRVIRFSPPKPCVDGGKQQMSNRSCKKERKRRDTKEASKKNVEITNRRDDEIKVESHRAVASPDADSPSHKDSAPAFYGTIEAERCAGKAAEHIQQACASLKRLQFVAEAVYPKAQEHIDNLTNIGNDVKEFNAQIKTNRAKVPTNSINGNHVARFVLENQ